MRWPNSVCLSDGAALLLLQVRQQAPVRIGGEQEPVRAEAEARAQAAIPAAGASGSVRTPGAVKLTAGIATQNLRRTTGHGYSIRQEEGPCQVKIESHYERELSHCGSGIKSRFASLPGFEWCLGLRLPPQHRSGCLRLL